MAVDVVGAAELIEGVELGLSSSKTEAGSWKGMLGIPEKLPVGAELFDGEGDETVGLGEAPAPRGGLEAGLEDGIAETLGILLGCPIGPAEMLDVLLEEALKDGEEDVVVELVGAELIDGVELGISSTETGSWKAMLALSDGLPEGAELIDGEGDEAVGLVE